MELTRNDSKMLQGLAVMAMVVLHLFDRLDYQGLFQPLIFIKGIPLSFYIAQLSDFCVFCFAFCSGYAHMKMYGQENYYKKRIIGILRLLIKYWIVIAVFSVISIIIGSYDYMPGSFLTLLGNVFLYNISYNGAWWYMWAYTLIVLISPVILHICKKYNPVVVLFLGFLVYSSAYYVRFNGNHTGFVLEKYGPFGMTLFEYIVGCICYRTKFFSWGYKYWQHIQSGMQWIIAIFIVTGLLLFRTLVVASLFVAPCSGAFIIILFHFWRKPEWKKEYLSLSESNQHTSGLRICSFYLYLFKNFVYIARYPMLIFILMMLMTISLSLVLSYIEKPLIRKLT